MRAELDRSVKEVYNDIDINAVGVTPEEDEV